MNLVLLVHTKQCYALFLFPNLGHIVKCIESVKFAFDKKKLNKIGTLGSIHVFSKEEAEEQHISVEKGIMTSELREFLVNNLGEDSENEFCLGVANETLQLQISKVFKKQFPCLCNPFIVEMFQFLTLQAATFIDLESVEGAALLRGDAAGLLQTNKDNVEQVRAKKSGAGRPSTTSSTFNKTESSEIASLNKDYEAILAATAEMCNVRGKLNMERERRRKAEADMAPMNQEIERLAGELASKVERLHAMELRLRENIESIEEIFIKVKPDWAKIAKVLKWYAQPEKISSTVALRLSWQLGTDDQDYISDLAWTIFKLKSIAEKKSPQRDDTGQYTQLKRYI